MLSSLYREWRSCLLAIGFFTRLPVPSYSDYVDDDLNHAAKYFPLVGLLVGGLGALVYSVSCLYLPNSLAILMSMAMTIYITGAFHEDGLADSADGLGGGWHREQILAIMVDSRLGTYGAIALILALVTKFHLLQNIQVALIPISLVLAHALSRLCGVWVMATLDYAKPEGKAKPLATKLSITALCFANLTGIVAVLICGYLLHAHYGMYQLGQLLMFILPLVFTSFWWWRHKIKRSLGGYTGDTLGAAQQLSELATYLGIVLWSVNS